MTFTTRSGQTTCDSCDTPVNGRTWRQLAQHLCPRTVADPDAKNCEHCGDPLTVKADETPKQYRTRRFCDLSCSKSHYWKAKKP